MLEISRGDIFLADLSPVVGSEQGGVRPVIIIQNDIGNKYSPTTIVCAVTSKLNKTALPTHVKLRAGSGLQVDSIVLCEHVRTIDKTRLNTRLGRISNFDLSKVNRALSVSVGVFIQA